MELIKDRIRTDHFVGRASTQMTLDDDFNVPDVNPDIDKIIEEAGEIKITDAKPADGKIIVRGKLEFAVLYISNNMNQPLHKMSGSISFEESLNMDQLDENDEIKVNWDMEDLRTRMINSRKISVRSIVSLTASAHKIIDEEAAVGVSDSDSVYLLTKSMDISQIHIQKKDIVRVKKEIFVPAAKPNILEMIWNRAMLNSMELKVLDGRVNMRGDFGIFILYSAQEEQNPLQYFNTSVDFNESVDCPDAKEEMIGHIEVKLIQKEVNVRDNEDGEPRKLEVELVLELNMAIYDEKHIQILDDIYSNTKKIEPVVKNVLFDNILMKNQSMLKLGQKIKIKNDQAKILQICQTNANVKIDRTQVTETGILVEGVVYVQILYIAADDKIPINALKGMIPFSHVIEVEGMHQGCTFEIIPVLEQVGSTMADSEEIEVRAELFLNSIVFDRIDANIIVDVSEHEPDYAAIEKMPGIVGYIVNPGDTMWMLAKRFYTTKARIMEINHLESEELKPRQKLVILKESGVNL